MSNILKFVEKVKSDAALRAKVESLSADNVTSLLVLATEIGLPFGEEEYRVYQNAGSELTDQQLDTVSGGDTGVQFTKLAKSTRPVIRID